MGMLLRFILISRFPRMRFYLQVPDITPVELYQWQYRYRENATEISLADSIDV